MVSLALQDAYLQVPLITIRVVIFASWWEKGRTSSGSSVSVSHRASSLHEDYDSHFRHPPQVWTIDSSWPLQNSSLVYLGVEIWSLPFLVRPPPDESAISCDYSRSFCQPHLLQRPSSMVSWASRTIGISCTTSFRSPGSLSVESFFSGGLEWSSCVKEYLSLFRSETSAYQTLRMWVAGPHRRTPRLGPFVSSSEESLH